MIAHPCAIMDASFGSTAMDGGDIKQKRCFPKASLLENSQVNLQHGRCKLTKHR